MAQKILKIVFILFILVSLCMPYIYATDIEMDLPDANVLDDTNNLNSEINEDNQSDENALLDENTSDQEDLPTDSDSLAETLNPTTVSTESEGGLSITNIINILLITVGIVIILLAIAIIIRLKS